MTGRAQDDERLSAYLDGELPLEERDALEAELARDDDLRARLEALRILTAALSDDVPPPVPDGIAARISDAVAGAQRKGRPSVPRTAFRRWRTPIAAAATVIVALLVGVVALRTVPPDRLSSDGERLKALSADANEGAASTETSGSTVRANGDAPEPPLPVGSLGTVAQSDDSSRAKDAEDATPIVVESAPVQELPREEGPERAPPPREDRASRPPETAMPDRRPPPAAGFDEAKSDDASQLSAPSTAAAEMRVTGPSAAPAAAAKKRGLDEAKGEDAERLSASSRAAAKRRGKGPSAAPEAARERAQTLSGIAEDSFAPPVILTLRWTPRAGVDAEETLKRLVEASRGRIARGAKTAGSWRVSLPAQERIRFVEELSRLGDLLLPLEWDAIAHAEDGVLSIEVQTPKEAEREDLDE